MKLSKQTIYVRTSLGDEVRRHRQRELPKQLRLLLNIVDGQATVEQITSALPNIEGIDLIIEALETLGLIFPLKDALHSLVSKSPDDANRHFFSGGDLAHGLKRETRPWSLDSQVRNVLMEEVKSPSTVPLEPSRESPADASLAAIKVAMVNEIRSLLGGDAAPAIEKIQASNSREALALTLVGLTRVVRLYVSPPVAERFSIQFSRLLR